MNRAWPPLARAAAVLALAGLGLSAPAAAADGAAGASTGTAIDTSAITAKPRRSGLPPHWQRGVFMEIFVRAYQDSDGDGVGDLRGLIGRLDYLQDLGIRGLWLMPVTPSADGDHGYATTDFRAIEPAYGTLADFDELLKQAHARGIGVIADYVLNHAAASHPMFAEARSRPDSAFRPWFVWSEDAPPGWDIWGHYPWYHTASEPWTFRGDVKTLRPPPGAQGFYFGTFGPHMPDFDFRHPPVLQYHLSSLRFWLNRGLDGFRLDAVPHLVERSAKDWNDQPESRRLTKRIQDLIKSYPGRFVVCEATAKPLDYGDPAVCGGAFAFGYVQHFAGAALGRAESVQALARYYRTARPTMATFVSNHDIFAGQRLWDQVGGDETAYRLAAAGYLLQPGTPFVYYGEENGQAGLRELPADQPLRGPMSWSAEPVTAGFTRGTPFRPASPNAATHNAEAQQRDPGSIRAFYKALIGLRNARPSIARGSFEHAFADGLVLGFQRRLGRERTLVLVNYGREAATLRVPGVAPRARLRALYPAGGAAGAVPAHGTRLTLPARSVQVFALGA